MAGLTQKTKAGLPLGTRLGFSMGSFVTGAFGTVPGLVLLPYLTDTMAIPAALAGILVVVPKAWDVVFNPIAGRISDASLATRGTRRPFLLYGGIGVALFFAALFAGPGLGAVWLDAAYLVVVFILCATAFAFFQVPFNALPAELTPDYEERTRLNGWRIAVLTVAILVSGGVAPEIIDLAGGGAPGYRAMGVFVAVLMAVGTIGVYFGIRRAPVAAVRQPTPRWGELLVTMRGWRPFRYLLGVYFLQSLGISTLLAGVVYVSRDVLGDAGLRSALFVGFVGPAMLVMPLCLALGRRFGKLTGMRIFTVIFAIALFGLLASRVMPLWGTFVFVALAGVGYAGIQVFPLAILPDLISAEEERTGAARAGVAAGVWTAGETLGLALGPGLLGAIVNLGGYVPSFDGNAVQPSSAITAILIGFSLIPAILVTAALPLMRKSLLEVGR